MGYRKLVSRVMSIFYQIISIFSCDEQILPAGESKHVLLSFTDLKDELNRSQLLMMDVDDGKYQTAFGDAGGLTFQELLTVTQEDTERRVDLEIKSILENEGKELDANGDGKIDWEGRAKVYT